MLSCLCGIAIKTVYEKTELVEDRQCFFCTSGPADPTTLKKDVKFVCLFVCFEACTAMPNVNERSANDPVTNSHAYT